MAEVEPQPVGRVKRAALGDVIAKALAERFVQKVRGRVVGADVGAASVVDRQLRALPRFERAFGGLGDVHEKTGDLFGVGDRGLAGVGHERSAVANLTAAFGVERRLVQDDADVACRGVGGGSVLDEGQDLPLGDLGVVAEEFGDPVLVGDIEIKRFVGSFARAGPGRAGFGLLFGHGGVKAVGVNAAAHFAQSVLREVEGEAERVVELEGRIAGQVCAVSEGFDLFRQQAEAAVERFAEAGFFGLQRFGDQALSLS